MTEETAETRPEPFEPGMSIGLHLTIERLLSMGPGRTYYLANNHKPRWYTHICWSCGNKHNPPRAPICEYCHRPITRRRFLLSCRWTARGAEEFHHFAAARIQHLGINSPIVLYRYRDQLLAFHEIAEEALLIDEPAPLRPRTLLAGAWTLAAAIIELMDHGIVLDRLGPEHVLVGKNGSRLWDIDIREVRPRRIHPRDPASDDAARMLGALMLPYVPLDQLETLHFFQRAAAGDFEQITSMQRALRAFARSLHLGKIDRIGSALSSVGRHRPENEDSWGWLRIGGHDVFVVADGMGGYEAGDIASQTAVRTALQVGQRALSASATPSIEQALSAMFSEAHTAVQAVAEAHQAAGTTMVVLVVDARGGAWLGHIGDSRAYRVRGDALHPLTEDHSMVAAMVASGKIDREAARTHPRANVLLQFLGGKTTPEPEIQKVDGKKGDRILLCTDGLWGEMPEVRMEELLDARLDPRRQVRVLVNQANDLGGRDNITAMVVEL